MNINRKLRKKKTTLKEDLFHDCGFLTTDAPQDNDHWQLLNSACEHACMYTLFKLSRKEKREKNKEMNNRWRKKKLSNYCCSFCELLKYKSGKKK